MFESITRWVKQLFNKVRKMPPKVWKYTEKYEDINNENITATIADKLAKLTKADSTIAVGGTGKRADLIRSVIKSIADGDMIQRVTAQMLGKGGKVIVPRVAGNQILLDVADQSRMLIHTMRGENIVSATLMAEVLEVEDKTYIRWVDYTVGSDGAQSIRNRATTATGTEVSMLQFSEWADIDPEVVIPNTDRVLFAFLRCPRDNRMDDRTYGVPITYGAERNVAELAEHMNIYRREYRLSRTMLGLSSSLWRNRNSADGYAPANMSIDDIRRTVQDSDDPFIPLDNMNIGDNRGWDYFSPAIRHGAMEVRKQSLSRQVELACGLSQGMLTERQATNYANKDEVRASQYDTFSVVHSIREVWEKALHDIAYSVDVLAEAFGLTPYGARDQWELSFDWDTSLVESTSAAYQQISEGESRGAVSLAEFRQWIRGGTLEEAQKAVDEIKQSARESPLDAILQDGDDA